MGVYFYIERNLSGINQYNIILYLFVLVMFKFCVLPFLFGIFTGYMEFEFIRPALAESVSDSDSEFEDEPKVDKGKRKATEDEVRKQMGYSSDQVANESETSANNNKFIQEERDRVYAKTLQEQEDRAYAEYLQENTEKVRSISPSSDDYSVYSSEIHSDDSENTINKKLEVKELEKTLKRKNPSNDDIFFENTGDKKLKKN
jgi:hypothetical protein